MDETAQGTAAWCALACALTIAGGACEGGDGFDQVDVVGSALTSGPLKVNAGDNGAQSPFVADTNFTGGSTVTRGTNVIDMSAVNGIGRLQAHRAEHLGEALPDGDVLGIGSNGTVYSFQQRPRGRPPPSRAPPGARFGAPADLPKMEYSRGS